MNQHPVPERHHAHSRTLVGLLVALLAILGLGGTAAAGGWAVTTLDATPVPVPGEPVDVGFTIRQHGVTPVDIADGVAIEVVAADGTVQRFPAERQGVVGHYVASVVFPAAGDFNWSVIQGSFGPQDLGVLSVDAATSGAVAGAGSEHRFPAVLRYGLIALAVCLAAFAIVDFVSSRRRRTAAA
ncbi:MAG: hypothetical protein Q8M22_12840 [Actinomycetota bacterium]|nr:hypothetical protein [Actinomycetota bacterium]